MILAWGLLPQLCAVLVLLGASRSTTATQVQTTWRVLAVGISLYGIALLWLNLELRQHRVLPVPYFTDGIWMIAYGCLFAGIMLSGRPKRIPPPLTTLIDSLLIAFAVMTLAAATVLRGLITGVGSGFWREVTALAYPLWDLALLGALAGGIAINRPRLERWRWTLLAGVLLLVTGDIGYLRYAASGAFSLHAWYRPLYLLSWLIIAFSPWVPPVRGGTTRTKVRLWRQFVPGAVVVVAGGVLLAGDFQHRSDSVSSIFAAIALMLVLIRVIFTFRETRAHAAAAANARLAAIVESTGDSIISLSLDGEITSWNAAAERIYGYSAAEAIGQSGAMLLPEGRNTKLGNAFYRLLAGEHVTTYEAERQRKDGSLIDVETTISVISDPAGNPTGVAAISRDVTEEKRLQRELEFLASHDRLTGLWNRHRFELELERHVQAARSRGIKGALLILDVDDFKAINDTLGHEAGDQLIVSIAGILKQHLHASDVLARLGGDEFAVLLRSADHDAAGEVAAELEAAVRTDVSQLGDHHRQVACSIGVAPFECTETSVKRSMIEAELAMYDVKAADGDGYAFYATATESNASGTQARLTWTARIEHAIDEDGFVLVAQPILDLHSDKVHQHELLVRMRGDDGELIPPVTFLGVAERFGLIGQLDAWVVEHAITLLAQHPQLQLEVNISGKSLGDQKLLRHIDRCLREHPIDPTHLIFEVTETAAVSDILHAQSFAEHLRDYGCRFALDDFGAGFGSFYYFKHLPFDYVKIDGEFVKQAATSQVDQLVVQAVVEIARGLGKETIAEFVADGAIKQTVKELAVDYAQGYYVGKPMSIDELVAAEREPRPDRAQPR